MSRPFSCLPPEQQAIRDKCFHPTGTFVEFTKEEVEQSIPERFEKIVRQYPDRLAVKAGSRSLSYEALNQAANRVARAILRKCGQRKEPVALLFEHGIDAIVAILGTLKAGKFYFALDPLFPAERIAYMLEDSQACLIATNNRNVDLAHQLTNKFRAVLNTDEIDGSLPCENVALAVLPDDLAAILYTSGSTGKPKAVVQNHRNHLCSVMVNSNEMHISFHDRLTLLHSVSFGSSRGHLFQALLNGASLFPYDIKSEGIYRLPSWLEAEQITVFHSPPAVFRQLAELLPEQAQLSSLRLIRLSGAPITQPDFDLYKKNFSPTTLLELHLGSTETRAICFALVDHTFAFPKQGSPVGYCCPDKKVLLLNQDGDEVARSEVGEIAVKGPNLNPTYWRRPELTSEEFLPTPNSAEERIYLTGDLGRMLPDGFLIHLGRKDSLVKIRGYRVETAEVERALLAHPLIKDAAVVAWDRQPGEKTLVGYVVARGQSGLTVSELRAFLRNQLPDYMIPLKFVFLDSLPLTNGKLDRGALPEPAGERPELSQPYVAPQSEVEQELVRTWEEVLDIRPIGIHDNFFDLGGHSLAATRVLSRVVRKFQVGLRLDHLFQTSTVAGLAEQIPEQPRIKGIGTSFGPVRKRQKIDRCPLSLTQQRLWFLHQLEPESCAYNLLSVIRLTGPLDVTALQQSLDKVIERHEVLRTIFTDHDGNAQQVILPSLALDLTVVDLRETAHDSAPESKVPALAMELVQTPFDLASGPLLRVKLLRLGEDQYGLLQTIHHIVYDAWSSGIFARDLSHFYSAIVKGETPAVQPLSIQYGDFAIWQHERFQADEFNDGLEYWKRQLADLIPLQMPAAHPRPAMQTHRGGKKSFVLNEALTAAIKTLSRNENATLFMTLLAAFQTLLHRYTGQDDIAVGTAIDGRPQRETEDVIGFFLNTLVMRTQFAGEPTFRELLERVREVCLGAFHHRDLPFEKLVEALHPERNLSCNPFFGVGFALQNTPALSWRLSGVAAQKWELDSSISQFDLHVFMEEEGQILKGTAIFNTDLFDAATIERMVGHFQVLLEGIVADPERRVGDLAILTDSERHQLLIDWNHTEQSYPKNKTCSPII